MAAYNLSAIIQLLNPDNTISAHRMLAHAIGMTETIIYSALISKQTYYSQKGMLLEGGWFFSTSYDLQESTTFGIKAQRTAIKHLIEHGMIESEYKGLPAKRYFKVVDDTENLMRLIDEGTVIAQGIVNNSKEKISEKSQNRSGKQLEKTVHTDTPKVEPTAVSCSAPADIPCSYPKAVTRDCPADTKTKDNIKPKKLNREINRSINRSDKSENRRNDTNVESVENVKKADRQNYKPMKFAEVMKSLGLDWYEMTANEPKSEKHFEYWDETDRKTQKCKIPYSLKNDKRNMKAALRYLCAYSYYFSENRDEQRRALWETMICSIAEMVEYDSVRVNGKQVMYYEIIDRLNDIVSQSYISECFVSFEDEWTKIVSEKEITHPKAYMKSCLWNWICDFEFEEYNDIAKWR